MNLPLIFSVYFSFNNNNKKGNYLAIIIICKDISIVCFLFVFQDFSFVFFPVYAIHIWIHRIIFLTTFFINTLLPKATHVCYAYLLLFFLLKWLSFFFIFLKIFISLSFLLFSINFIREDFGFPRPTHFPSSNLVSLFFFFSFYSYIFLMKIIVSSRNDIWEGLCNHIDSL
jgi:hypothetical protein